MTKVMIDATDMPALTRMIERLVDVGATKGMAETYLALAYDMGRSAAERQEEEAGPIHAGS